MYMYIRRTRCGWEITTYTGTTADRIHYIGYGRRNAIQAHRQRYGLRYKRLTVIEL